MLPKIKPPKFKVAGKFILNEYELRCLQVEIGNGHIKSGMSVEDVDTKQKAYFLECGALSNRINGLSISAEFSLELMAIKRKKSKF